MSYSWKIKYSWTRNQEVIAHTITPEEKLLHSICKQRGLFLQLWSSSQPVAQPRLVSWQAPVAPTIAVNCDGSSLGVPARSGFGGCIQNSSGSWLAGFMGFGAQGLVLRMELLAIFHGLELAWNLEHRQVECFSDSLLAVNLIQTPPSHFHVEAVLLHHILGLLHRDWNARVTHVLREGNACANFLAKAGASQECSLSIYRIPLLE